MSEHVILYLVFGGIGLFFVTSVPLTLDKILSAMKAQNRLLVEIRNALEQRK